MPIAAILEPPLTLFFLQLFHTFYHHRCWFFIRFFLWFTTHQRHEDHEYFPDTSKEASKRTDWSLEEQWTQDKPLCVWFYRRLT